jgi:hypothetical protein
VYPVVVLAIAGLTWMGFAKQIRAGVRLVRFPPAHSAQYWLDVMAGLHEGTPFTEALERLPMASSAGSVLRDETVDGLGGQDTFYALDRKWAVSMRVTTAATIEEVHLLQKPKLLRHHGLMNKSDCLEYSELIRSQ